jgi:probable rRNA maturation factor
MILNRQSSVAVPLASLERFWARARRNLRLAEDSLTVCLVSEAQIARWNRAYRGKRGPTDVLSFPAEGAIWSVRNRRGRGAGPRGSKLAVSKVAKRNFAIDGKSGTGEYLGDIAIAPAVARRNARRLGRPMERELRILILHGALHLLGYDHETDNGEMDRIERRLRRRLGLGAS